MTVLDADRLHERIAMGHAELCAAHSALLHDIAEHDRVGAWRGYGARSEEDYLARWLDVDWRTARAWARQARVLDRHPELALAFAGGQMSIDKLDAACRLADAQDSDPPPPPGPDPEPGDGPGATPDPTLGPDPEPPEPDQPEPDPVSPAGATGPTDAPAPDAAAELLDLIDSMSPRQLDELARRARQASAAAADALWRRRHVDVVRDAAARRLSLKLGEFFDDDAAVLWAALTDYVSNTRPDPTSGEHLPLKARFADALVAMAHAYLDGRGASAHRPLAFVHIDARVLAGQEAWAESGDGAPLAAETARRLACACKLTAVSDDERGNPLNLGRRSREVSWQQMELIRLRDGGCRLCGAQLFLQAHHVRWWRRDMGRTDIANLITTCQTCHHLIHEGGWVVEGDDANEELRFVSPAGAEVRRAPRPRPPGAG
jgi:hypothetical protein